MIEENKRKFAADNVEVIEGLAPEALEELETPTHAFIGGSAGNLKEIMDVIYEKNPECRVVINTIALNTLVEVLSIVEEMEGYETEIIQLQSSFAKKVGKYQMMTAQNPIHIISIWKSEN